MNNEEEEEDEFVTNFLVILHNALCRPPQVRGQHQNGASGTFKQKDFHQLSWRGLIKNLYNEYYDNVRFCCECDALNEKKPQAMILFINRINLPLSDFFCLNCLGFGFRGYSYEY